MGDRAMNPILVVAAVAITLTGVLVGTAVSLIRYYWIDAFDRRRR